VSFSGTREKVWKRKEAEVGWCYGVGEARLGQSSGRQRRGGCW
jgi:hypothetical protein